MGFFIDFAPSQWRMVWALVLTLSYAALCWWVFWRRGRKIAQEANSARERERLTAQNAQQILVAWASQTGQAQMLAEQTADFLAQAGHRTRLCALNAVDAQALRECSRVVFVASTYGEGDPPDSASVFFSQIMALEQLPSHGPLPALSHMQFAMLALGDSQYAQFCGFARALQAWLQAQGASAAFAAVEVDAAAQDGDVAHMQQALPRWQQALAGAFGSVVTSAPNGLLSARGLGVEDAQTVPKMAFSVPKSAEFTPWQIVRRERLNAGSQGAGVWLVELAPSQGACPQWASGDLIDIHTKGDAGRARSYSIANLPSDGRVQLLVRQAQREDGTLGHTSTALCQTLPIAQENSQLYQGDEHILRAYVRTHTAFRLEGNAARPLVLIGNGVGLAGLRSHLHARAAQWARVECRAPCWLLFGERQRHCDALLQAELQALHSQGVLERMDWAFSRDTDAHGQPQRVYVQDRVREAAAVLRQWVHERDAAIYVCGSLQGMATGVDEALREVLGSEQVNDLLKQGRYRRDVY